MITVYGVPGWGSTISELMLSLGRYSLRGG